MNCRMAREKLSRRLDDELSPRENEQLDSHLSACASCSLEMKLLALPRNLSRMVAGLEPSPYFYSRLMARIRAESQGLSVWRFIPRLSRQVLPALVGLTLMLVFVVAYLELEAPRRDAYRAYDSIFFSGDSAQSQRMFITEQAEITDDSVFRAIAEESVPRSIPEADTGFDR